MTENTKENRVSVAAMLVGQVDRWVIFWNTKTIHNKSLGVVERKARRLLDSGKWKVAEPISVHYFLGFSIKLERKR